MKELEWESEIEEDHWQQHFDNEADAAITMICKRLNTCEIPDFSLWNIIRDKERFYEYYNHPLFEEFLYEAAYVADIDPLLYRAVINAANTFYSGKRDVLKPFVEERNYPILAYLKNLQGLTEEEVDEINAIIVDAKMTNRDYMPGC